jgi:hypothetical protein
MSFDPYLGDVRHVHRIADWERGMNNPIALGGCRPGSKFNATQTLRIDCSL